MSTVACYEKAIALQPNFAPAYNNLGSALRQQGKLEGAINRFQEALKYVPRHFMAQTNIGTTLAQQGKVEEAITALRRAIEMEPRFLAAYGFLSDTLIRAGRVSEAKLVRNNMLAMVPNHPRIQNDIAWNLATRPEKELRDPQIATELSRKATQLAPKEPAFWNTYGVSLYRAGQYEDAIDALAKSRELDSDNSGLATDAIFLALAHWQLDDRDIARDWLSKADEWIQANPADEELQRFRMEAGALMESDSTPEEAGALMESDSTAEMAAK